MTSTSDELSKRITALQQRAEQELTGKIFAVMSSKGGVGKTTIAMELAMLFQAVLVDFDWDDGNATRALGYLHERYKRVPLLDALATGRTPQPRKLHKRPDLVPGHPDIETNEPSPTQGRDALTAWAMEWKRPVVVDLHPGGGDAVYGAIAAADAVVAPMQLATRELDALEGQLKELHEYPVILVPNEVPPVPPQAELNRLKSLSHRFDVEVTDPLYEHTWYRRRKLRTVVTSSREFSRNTAPFVEELVTMAEGVFEYAAR